MLRDFDLRKETQSALFCLFMAILGYSIGRSFETGHWSLLHAFNNYTAFQGIYYVIMFLITFIVVKMLLFYYQDK